MAGTFLSGNYRAAVTTKPKTAQRIMAPASLAAEVKPTFRQLVRILNEDGSLRPSDAPLLAQAAESIYLAQKSMETVIRFGVLVTDKAHGSDVKRNPALLVWRQATDTARACLSLLGGSPAARMRIASAMRGLPEDSRSALDDLKTLLYAGDDDD